MRDRGSTVTCALLVLALGWGAQQIASSAWDSVVHYRTPYRFHARLAAGPRLVPRVILVVIDGLRLDASRQLSFLNELRRRGADGRAQVGVPSLSNPGRTVLATGAWAGVHGITSNFAWQMVEADSVFSRAHAAGLRTAVAGSKFWSLGFAPHLDELWQLPGEPKLAPLAELRQWQRRRCAEQLEFVRSTQFNFLAIDWTALDTASHDFGPFSPAARETQSVIDDCLRDLVASQNLRRTVVIVTSDHGHVDRGGHGGSEHEVLEVPLVLAGGPVRRGAQFRAQQVDVASTICALLGLPFPSTSEGSVLLDALALDPGLRRALLSLQKRQQKAFASFRRVVLVGTQEEAVTRARRGRSSIAKWISLALLFLLAWLFIGVLGTPAEWRGAPVALAVFYLAYLFSLDIFGLGHSLSAVNREEHMASFLLGNMLLAGGALLLAAFAMGLMAAHADLRLSAATTLLISLSLAAQILWAHWWEGLWMGQWMPDLNVLFKAYMHLLAMTALSVAMFAAPAATWAGARLRRGPPQQRRPGR